MASQRRLRVGLIGTGTIAFSAHLPAIRKLRDELELVAVADIRAETALRAAEDFGAEAHYVDYREMLARHQLDFVDICTPEFLHAEQTEAAAAAGVHVICEKPMSHSLADADRMINACKQAGLHLMVAHSRRFTGRYRRIREAIDRGDIGEVRYVRENERRPRTMYDRLALAASHWTPDGQRSWLTLAEYSKGAAMANAVHETDLAGWFIGRPARSVYAESRITQPDGEVPDMLSYTIRFEGGAIGAAEVVNNLPRGYPYYHMMEVIGTDGRIRAMDPYLSPLTIADETALTQPDNFSTLLHVGQAYVDELSAFAHTVRTGEPLPLDPHEARNAVELALSVVQSSARGAPVTLPLIEEGATNG